MILTRNQYAKIAIKLWTIIFQIIGFGLIFLGTSIKIINNDSFKEVKIFTYVFDIFQIGVGITILIFLNNTVKVEFLENKASEIDSSLNE